MYQRKFILFYLVSTVAAQWGNNQGFQQGFQSQGQGQNNFQYGLSPRYNQPMQSQFMPRQSFGGGGGYMPDLSAQFAQFGSQPIAASRLQYPSPNTFSGSSFPQAQFPPQYNQIQAFSSPTVPMGTPLGQFNSAPQMGSLMPMGFQNQQFRGQFQNDQSINSISQQIPQPTGPTRVIPPFLKSATQSEQDEFYKIVQHPTWSPTEKQSKIEEFIRTMNANTQNVYAEYQRSWSGDMKTKRDKVHQKVSEMSPEAQEQFQKVSALMTNPNLTETDRLDKINALYAKISDSIKKEFDSKFVGL